METQPLSPEELFPTELIERMVHTFYGRIQDDEVLGPIFSKRIDDWPVHLGRMVLFWRAVLRSERVFTPSARGGPPALHRQIDELRPEHFTRWLTLFGEVVDSIYSAEAAKRVNEAAARIAAALTLKTNMRDRFGGPTQPARQP